MGNTPKKQTVPIGQTQLAGPVQPAPGVNQDEVEFLYHGARKRLPTISWRSIDQAKEKVAEAFHLERPIYITFTTPNGLSVTDSNDFRRYRAEYIIVNYQPA